MNQANLQAFAVQAADLMMRGAAAYIRSNVPGKPTQEQVEKVIDQIRARSGAAVDEALEDAKFALDARMDDAALALFKATLTGYGIEAAKAVFQ